MRGARGAGYAVPVEFETYPGGDLVTQGLADLAAGRETLEALLVAIGAPRLRSLGLEVGLEVPGDSFTNPEHQLYDLLRAQHGDAAHGRYNALIRRLVSFERTLACARTWTASA